MDSDSSPSIEVAIGNGAWRTIVTDPAGLVRRAAAAALGSADDNERAAPTGDVEVSIRLTDDGEVKELNRLYRGQDKPTNVLSFPGDDPDRARAPGQPLLLGDVVVAFETTCREAEAAARPPAAHLSHLVVHGVLHLLGHDHLEEAEAALMEGLEARLMGELGYADPHADAAAGAGDGAAATAPALEAGRPAIDPPKAGPPKAGPPKAALSNAGCMAFGSQEVGR